MTIKWSKNQSYRLWWGAADQCTLSHGIYIHIMIYRECWTIQLKCTFETKQETITVSHHPTHQHGHTNFWYVYLLERALELFFKYLDCSYNVWYVYINDDRYSKVKHVYHGTVQIQNALSLGCQATDHGGHLVFSICIQSKRVWKIFNFHVWNSSICNNRQCNPNKIGVWPKSATFQNVIFQSMFLTLPVVFNEFYEPKPCACVRPPVVYFAKEVSPSLYIYVYIYI